MELCTDMVLLASERWQKSPWAVFSDIAVILSRGAQWKMSKPRQARMDALMAVWAKTPMYLLPEKCPSG